jgi:oxygen-independent coproporphyrinogen-3 oxidase
MTPARRPIPRSPEQAIPSGIYVHLPYCRSRCAYCAFVVSTDASTAVSYHGALAGEMALLESETEGMDFDTVYLGGGTPSLASPPDLASLLDELRRRFEIRPGSEVTLEANPEDATVEAARAWAAAGVTRVSVGVQSFEDRELSAVGRRHDAARAARAVELLAGTGLSVSGDLILGLPEQTSATFGASLSRLCALGVGHVSVYLLEAEKSKTIEEDRRRHPSRYPSDDEQADGWLEMGERLAREGFLHYEVSNWALPGQESRHNRKYWERIPTLGLGVSAHEFWNGRRRANVSAIGRYIEEIEGGRRPLALDQPVSDEEAAREEIVLGLRLAEGVPEAALERAVDRSPDPTLRGDFTAWREAGLLELSAGRARLTERGFLLSNEILCRFV